MVKWPPFLVGHPESPSGPAGRTTEAKYLDIVRCQSNTNFDWGAEDVHGKDAKWYLLCNTHDLYVFSINLDKQTYICLDDTESNDIILMTSDSILSSVNMNCHEISQTVQN